MRLLLALIATVASLPLAGCGSLGMFTKLSERDCMMRVMYFESNRSSADGMLAVGTVVMNRVGTPGFPTTVCGVVGQRNQFAQGVLNKPMKDKRSIATVAQAADLILGGYRHPGVQSAKFFHTAGYRFGYDNMHYVLESGGNEFYEKY